MSNLLFSVDGIRLGAIGAVVAVAVAVGLWTAAQKAEASKQEAVATAREEERVVAATALEKERHSAATRLEKMKTEMELHEIAKRMAVAAARKEERDAAATQLAKEKQAAATALERERAVAEDRFEEMRTEMERRIKIVRQVTVAQENQRRIATVATLAKIQDAVAAAIGQC